MMSIILTGLFCFSGTHVHESSLHCMAVFPYKIVMNPLRGIGYDFAGRQFPKGTCGVPLRYI